MHDLPVLYLYIPLTQSQRRGLKLDELLFVSPWPKAERGANPHAPAMIFFLIKTNNNKRKMSGEAWSLQRRPTKAPTCAAACECCKCVSISLRTLTTWVCRDALALKWCWTLWMWELSTETSRKKTGSEAKNHFCQHSSQNPGNHCKKELKLTAIFNTDSSIRVFLLLLLFFNH